MIELSNSAIYCVIMGLSDNFTVSAQSVVLMVSTIEEAENDDSEACDIIFQTNHLIGNLVKKKFHSKDFKMLLT